MRFVSTPEVLERFVTIEREITQIEDSILLNEQANGQIDADGKIDGPTFKDSAIHFVDLD